MERYIEMIQPWVQLRNLWASNPLTIPWAMGLDACLNSPLLLLPPNAAWLPETRPVTVCG
jgi:hypothetical protein